MPHTHHEWLARVTSDIADDYERLRSEAKGDPQRAGHGGEVTWARLLQDWLPPDYEVATRKYVIPEEGDQTFETDLVVFSPSYPRRLREREEVLAGGVAGAFSVKLRLTSAGIRDGVERAVALHRAMKPRTGTARSELLGAFPVGLLAHSHSWKRPKSDPDAVVTRALMQRNSALVGHPREALDYTCVADLNTWTTMRVPYLPPHVLSRNPTASEAHKARGACSTAILVSDQQRSPAPVAILIAGLLLRLSYSDPSLRPMADGLRLTNTLGEGSGRQQLWNLDQVYSDRVLELLPSRGLSVDDPDWYSAYF